jgi:hypothetical protein
MRTDHPPLDVMYARARRERAEAIYRILILPVVRFFQKRGKPAPRRTVPLHGRLA